MKTIKLIVSDLHLASGDTMLDGFGERQQAALEGLFMPVEEIFAAEAENKKSEY